jgi:pimeloyl-ACP methyl ester carboxylesterase/DNA-binding CsgD family transcriptional regulator
MGQQVRFCTSFDGTRIAYASDGAGPPLARTTFYLNHLELDWRCPVWKPYLEELTQRNTLLRHDMRGFGLSYDEAPRQSLDAWVHDFEAVVDAAGLERFPIIGMCHGGAIAVEYAARHPERVTHLVLLGAYVRGALRRARNPQEYAARELMLKTVELGWGEDNEAFNQVWPTLLQPSSTLERLRALADVQRQSSTSANAVRLLRAAGQLDISEAAPRVKCPTLVFHTKKNRAAPFEEGRLLASLIPNAKFVPLEGANHVLTELEPAWADFLRELRAFLPGGSAAPRKPVFACLTAREHEILELIAQGRDNAQIAARLGLSEKTVRNHNTRIFDKLAVENRPQAIVRAREAGFGEKSAAV